MDKENLYLRAPIHICFYILLQMCFLAAYILPLETDEFLEATASNYIGSICFCNMFWQNSNPCVFSEEIPICCIIVAYT